MSKVTLTEPISSGWHSGIMSDVRLAAWMPATLATASTSPFLTSRLAIATVVSGFMNTLHRATARRCVGSLGVTSTIRACPAASRCVNSMSFMRHKRYSVGSVGAGEHGTGVDDLEFGARDGLQLVEVLVVPPGAG